MALIDPSLARRDDFQRCLTALRSGQLHQAEGLARQLPPSADVLHLLGVIMMRGGRVQQASAYLAQALGLAPDAPGILFDAALADGRLERHDLALDRLDQVLRAQPDHVGAMVNRGFALRSLERHAEALAGFDRALALQPTLLEALHGRGHALAALQRPEEALQGYDKALAVAPDMVDALVGKGNVLISLDRRDAALACFDRALGIISDPRQTRVSDETRVHVHFFRGDALRLLERRDEALESYDRALAIRPGDPDALIGRGRVLLGLRAFEEALACYDQVIAVRDDDERAHDHRSRALRELGRYQEALEAAERSLQVKPGNTGGLNSRANVVRMLGRTAAAEVDYRQAISAATEPGPLRFNLAVCLLLAGDFARGWPEYEYRWTLETLGRRKPRFHQPMWTGREDIAGRRILLHAEQGLGDTIQFCRYAQLVAARGATVILGAQPELRPLLAGLPGVADVVDRTEAPLIFEYYCPLLSLPLAFGTVLETVPAEVPYLTVPVGHQVTWRARLGARAGPRIGIAWSGNKDHLNDHNRSIPLHMLQPLLSLGLKPYCLQRDLRPEDVTAFALAGNIRFFGPDLRDFADTAALIQQMDLIITVDTAVAHLAGALGKTVWLLLPFAPDWRWMLNTDRSPWYPTMRLFRQAVPLDWEPVIARVGDELAGFIATFGETPASDT